VKRSHKLVWATAWTLVCGGALAQNRLIEDIQVSKRGEEATITIELACPMRFQSDVPTEQGILLEVRVSPLESCRELGAGNITSEVYHPVGGQLAFLNEVEYQSLGLGENLLMFHFDRAVDYRVAQRGDLRTLQLIVQVGNQPAVTPVPQTATPPPSAPPVAQAPAPSRRAAPRDESRTPISPRVREPSATPDYVINLQSTREPVAPDLLQNLVLPQGVKPYVSETTVDGQKWYRLRAGFFASEQDAKSALEPLATAYPRAWVGRAEPAEVAQASSFSFAAGGTVVENAPAEQQTIAATPAAPPGAASSLGPEGAQKMLEDARQAMLAQDYAKAIDLYTRLLQGPGDHQAEAREYLGLARERSGQIARATAEYRQYLKDYPEGEGTRRVQQRLQGLVLASEAPREQLRRTAVSAEGARWDVSTGLSQYYRRDLDQFDTDLPQLTTLEALFTDLDLSVRHTGGSLDLIGRISVSNMYDLIGEDNNGPGNINRVSYAYVDMNKNGGDWTLRFGRQTLHNWGVLGRFDGLHFAYEWAPNRRVHFTGGYPVDSTRYGVETDRLFYGVAVDFDHLIGSWDFSTFINSQTIEGYTDRQAAGFEVHYLDDKRSLTTMIDYDTSFSEINTALLLATWRFDNRLTLTALVDSQKGPVLSTRNALIGQTVSTIDDLLLTLTEDQIHQLALDRTADTSTVTLGLSKPLFERFQINADVTMVEIGDTPASFGVPAVPGTGQQIYYSMSFVGSGLFGGSDVHIFNLRHGESDEFTTDQLTWDARFRLGRRLRVNPRLTLAVWDSAAGLRRETVNPSFRFLLNMKNRYRLEVEVGGDQLSRTDLSQIGIEQKATGNYVNIGYRADF
jgi:tetratricopeptide (TPR) repeat protein